MKYSTYGQQCKSEKKKRSTRKAPHKKRTRLDEVEASDDHRSE